VQWTVNKYVIRNFADEFEEIDRWSLNVFQWIFSGSTLFLVLSYVITDLITIANKQLKKIREEVNNKEVKIQAKQQEKPIAGNLKDN
jgi:hypothetical protein